MKNPHWSNRNRFISIVRIACAGTLITGGVVGAILALALTANRTTSAGAAAAQSSGFYALQIPLSGTSTPQTGAFPPSGPGDETQADWPGQIDEPDGSPGPFPGIIVNRSLSRGNGNGVRAAVGRKAKSNPQLNFTFTGLNIYQQRYARGG